MWPVILAGLRAYTPYLVFPFAFVVGSVGYFIESGVSNNKQRGLQQDESTIEKRSERLLSESTGVTKGSGVQAGVYASVLSRNLDNPSSYEVIKEKKCNSILSKNL